MGWGGKDAAIPKNCTACVPFSAKRYTIIDTTNFWLDFRGVAHVAIFLFFCPQSLLAEFYCIVLSNCIDDGLLNAPN
jgi:hypothetical protein